MGIGVLAVACAGSTKDSSRSVDQGDGGGTSAGGAGGGGEAGATSHAGGAPSGGAPSHDGGHPDCVLSTESAIPGVHIELPETQKCVFRLAEVSKGIRISYDVVVDYDTLFGAVFRYPAGPGPYEDPGVETHNYAGPLEMNESVTGGEQFYCYCDLGGVPTRCALPDGGATLFDRTCPPTVLRAGTYPVSFYWDGHNWEGPSDTSQPKGPSFPAGDYELTVKTNDGLVPMDVDAGTQADGGTVPTRPASASAKFLIRLVP